MDKEALANFRAACELLVQIKQLHTESRKVRANPKLVAAQNARTVNELRQTSDPELANLARNLLSAGVTARESVKEPEIVTEVVVVESSSVGEKTRT